MWELQDKIQSKTTQTLSTAITVSSIITEIRGEDVLIQMPYQEGEPYEAARRTIGEGEIVAASLAYHERIPVTFNPDSLVHRNDDGSTEDHSDAISRVQEGIHLDLASGSGRTIERIELGEFPPEHILELSLKHRQLAFALEYYNRGLGERDGGRALAEFSKSLEAVERHASKMRQYLGFNKSDWGRISQLAQPFRHAPRPREGETILPSPDPHEVEQAKNQLERILEAFIKELSIA